MAITKEYRVAYTQVLEVLKYLKPEEYNRIPREKIELYEEYKDENLDFKYDIRKTMDSQISEEAKAVLANLFIKYISTLEDREKILQKERKEIYENELKKQQIKLNPLFEKKQEIISKEEVALVNVKENTNIFKKIFLKIKKFLGGTNES